VGAAQRWHLKGAEWLDVSTGGTARRDVQIADGVIVDDATDATVIDASGLTAMFGLWDCHAHPGGLMYDPDASGYFEAAPDRTIRAGENLQEAARMGVTGIRAVSEAEEIDLAWGKAYAAGTPAGPRVRGAGRGVRTTAGHGTAFPRTFTQLEHDLVIDGPAEAARAVRLLVERGAHWMKIMMTGGLYSPFETVDGNQFTNEELTTLMEVATLRGLPVAAHCGGGEGAIRFAELGGRSIEHGYHLDEEAAAVMAAHGTWYVPTVSVTHDRAYIEAEGWPEHAATRARETAPLHAESLRMCREAGVRIAVGADLNPIGPRLHRELEMLELAGMDRRSVLEAATVGGRALNGFGAASTPEPGLVADLILVEGDPMDDLHSLRRPRAVFAHGRRLVG
jgi:imidazolonepropionase-like amidohydrolase